jgi:hypothetical protein
LHEPAGDAEKSCRTVAGDSERGVVEGVRLDEGPVQVDAEHQGRGDAGGGGRDRQKCPFLRLTQ